MRCQCNPARFVFLREARLSGYKIAPRSRKLISACSRARGAGTLPACYTSPQHSTKPTPAAKQVSGLCPETIFSRCPAIVASPRLSRKMQRSPAQRSARPAQAVRARCSQGSSMLSHRTEGVLCWRSPPHLCLFVRCITGSTARCIPAQAPRCRALGSPQVLP